MNSYKQEVREEQGEMSLTTECRCSLSKVRTTWLLRNRPSIICKLGFRIYRGTFLLSTATWQRQGHSRDWDTATQQLLN